MANCLLELQKAAVSELTGDATLMAMVTGVHSHVPQDTVFPYVAFSTMQASNWRTRTTDGIRATLTLKIFSRYRGSKEALDIIDQIKNVLDNNNASMTGCTMVSLRYNNSNAFQQADGLTWEGNISFHAVIQED